MTRLIRALIDTQALRSNLRTVRARAPQSRVLAMVKANAYGHGLVPTALALAEADGLAVARLEEAAALRAAGVAQPIVLLEGVITREQILEAAQLGLDLIVHDIEQIELLEEYSGRHRFVLWIKIDTGMNRLGFRPEEFAAALARIEALAVPAREIRLLTHLARADELEVAATREQLERFRALTGELDLAVSMANSAGVLGWPEAHGDWIRPGLALYGVSPFAGVNAAAFDLTAVMTLETTVIAVRRVPRGESVGYGGAWRASADATVAILAGGYGDGLPRSLANGTPVLIEGARMPLVGRVSMDMIAVDVSGAANVRIGTRGVLWGMGLPVEEIARHAGTIPYELLCGVSQRVPLEIL